MKTESTENNDHAAIAVVIASFDSGYSYFAHHKPTGEDWYILGFDPKRDAVCVAGWPATIGKISDCENFEKNCALTEKELMYRSKTFGQNWL